MGILSPREQLVLSYINADVYEKYAESALSPEIKDHQLIFYLKFINQTFFQLFLI